jgi:uncharacterized membrane protein
MSASVWIEETDFRSAADTSLKLAARFWFIVAVAGQWIFLAYVIAFYGGTALHGNLEAWNKVLPHGHTPGDTIGNAAVATHLILAVVIMFGGPLNLIPRLRTLAPRFHRINGRVYVLAVTLTSIAGLYMVWTHASTYRVVQHVGVSIDAVLIITFAILAVRRAMVRDISAHRRWTLRLFMVVNAGWFFRIGLMQWVFYNRGPAGFDPETFTGPFINFLSYADYLLPLAILELYLRTKDRGGVSARFALAAALVVLTVMTGIGIFAASMVMWLPRM